MNKLRLYREVDGQPVGDLIALTPGDTLRVASDGRIEAVAGFHATEGTPVNAVAATGSLTLANQPSGGMRLVIGNKTYTFVAAGTAVVDGEINIGSDLSGTQANIIAAITGEPSEPSETEVNTAHTQVTCGAAWVANVLTLTARVKGAAGNAIATTDTLTSGSDGFGAATLANGVNGTVGLENQLMRDASYLYVALADNTVSDANWRRVSLGSVY